VAAVAPEHILRELADLWATLGSVLRACTLTLVVLEEASGDAAALGETIAALMPEHPARTIVVRLSGAGERALAERVYAQCWMPFGERRQICCEQIEITASDAALADLPSVVLPLAAPDLPVIVWSRSARLFEMPAVGAIARMAGIGWQGKSLALVTPQFGPHIRLSSVLTDMPLAADQPLKNRCGKCVACANACPADAIKNATTKDHYQTRDDALHFRRCVEQLARFQALPGIGRRLCGICLQACPFGSKNRRHTSSL